MNRKITAVLMFAIFIIAGCAAGAGGGADRDVITEQRIQASNANGVDQLIEWEEPRWLSNSSTRVYVDGEEWGTLSVLPDIRLSDVVEIRWWAPTRANAQYGAGHSAGVIQITRR
ncbi:MAG: hypothetical protein WD960_09965 [Gemmatimonadota bacterium]